MAKLAGVASCSISYCGTLKRSAIVSCPSTMDLLRLGRPEPWLLSCSADPATRSLVSVRPASMGTNCK